MGYKDRSTKPNGLPRSTQAFSAALRGHSKLGTMAEPGRVSSIVQAHCDAEPGPWDTELAIAARIEQSAVQVRALTGDLDPSGSVDISDVSLMIVDALGGGARGAAFETKALRNLRGILGVRGDFSLPPSPPVALGGPNGGDDGAGDNAGTGGARATLGLARTATPSAAAGAAPAPPTVPEHGGAGNWSHVLLAASAATARSTAQVDPGTGLDASGFPILARLSGSVMDQVWVRVDSQRPTLDWRASKAPRISSIVNARAALGQLIGHEAPVGEACDPCRRGNGPFDSCRVVFLVGLGFQWSLACACCQYSGAANKCTFRPSGDVSDTPRWIYDLVRRFHCDSILLKEPNLARYETACKPANASGTGMVPVGAAAKAGVPAAGLSGYKDKGKGEAVEAAAAAKSSKKRTAANPAGDNDKASKKKKAKKTPAPPARMNATPRSGPVFDSVLYQTPLDWPMVYRVGDEACHMDVLERLREVCVRVNYDYKVMREAAISKGWWSKDDDSDEEDSQSSCSDSSSDSADILNKAK